MQRPGAYLVGAHADLDILGHALADQAGGDGL